METVATLACMIRRATELFHDLMGSAGQSVAAHAQLLAATSRVVNSGDFPPRVFGFFFLFSARASFAHCIRN